MKIWIASYWFNRGQAVVGRYIRTIYERLERDTLVLARPTENHFYQLSFIDTADMQARNVASVPVKMFHLDCNS